MAQPTFIGTIALQIIFSKTQDFQIANGALPYRINSCVRSVRQAARHLKDRAVFTSLRSEQGAVPLAPLPAIRSRISSHGCLCGSFNCLSSTCQKGAQFYNVYSRTATFGRQSFFVAYGQKQHVRFVKLDRMVKKCLLQKEFCLFTFFLVCVIMLM